MKPTQEQVIAWARDCGAAVEGEDIIVAFEIGELEAFVALAYEAGRADENEACAKFIEQEYVRQFDEPWRDNLAKAIRARREQ